MDDLVSDHLFDFIPEIGAIGFDHDAFDFSQQTDFIKIASSPDFGGRCIRPFPDIGSAGCDQQVVMIDHIGVIQETGGHRLGNFCIKLAFDLISDGRNGFIEARRASIICGGSSGRFLLDRFRFIGQAQVFCQIFSVDVFFYNIYGAIFCLVWFRQNGF